MISVQHVTKTFSGQTALDDCCLSVERGTIYGLVGKNGAGKTTLLKILLGLLRPTAGTAKVLGMDCVVERTAILRQTGSVIETPLFYEHLSALENLRIHLAYMGVSAVQPAQWLKRVGLVAVGEQPVRSFSLGMRQRLALARAMVTRPAMLILDEPLNGLDPVGVREMGALFRELVAQEGMTILMSSHLLYEMEAVADHIGVMRDGRMVTEMARPSFSKKSLQEVTNTLLAQMEGGRNDDAMDAFRN